MNDLNTYLTEMKKSLMDKVFFIDKIDADCIVDFGCADGQLLKHLDSIFGDAYEYLGYEISDDMVRAAERNMPNGKFYQSWGNVERSIQGKTSALVLSSVIHEVYNHPYEIDNFWYRVWKTGFDYVIIRDMCVNEHACRPSDLIDVGRVQKNFPSAIKLAEWEAVWGPITDNISLVHFLLTYRFTENWDRELCEDYLPLTYEQLMRCLPDDYHLTYMEHYTLPFIAQQVKKDFDIDLKDRTHIKLILQKARRG